MPKVVVATATGFVDRAIPSPARVHTSRMTRQATRFLRMAWRICEGCTLLLIWSGVGLDLVGSGVFGVLTDPRIRQDAKRLRANLNRKITLGSQ